MNQLTKVDMRPMEYIEVLSGKPICIDIGGGWLFTSRLMSAFVLIAFEREFKRYLSEIKKLSDAPITLTNDLLKVHYFKQLAMLLYNMSAKNVAWVKRRAYKKYVMKKMIDDVPMMYEIFDAILRYNAEVKKKAQNLLEWDPWGFQDMQTIGGRPLSDFIQTAQNGEKCFMPRHLRNLNISMPLTQNAQN